MTFTSSLLRLLLICAVALLPSTPLWALDAPMPDWAQRFHIGGNGAVRLQSGAKGAQLDRNNGFSVYQAGLVFDVDLAENWSFWTDVVQIREAQNAATFNEQLYIRRDKVFNQPWLNAKFGRVFAPFGESYLLWNQIDNPLASNDVAFPWALDEGILAFGDVLPNGWLSYTTAIQNGRNQGINFPDSVDKAISVKLMTDPTPWLHFSSSFYNSGKRGNNTIAGLAEFWLSGMHITPLGATTAPGGASPSNFFDAQAWEQDLKLKFNLAEVGANFGYMHVMDGGGHKYDRYLKWYMAQLLGYIPATDKKAYLVARYSAIGTFNPNQGYRFAGTEIAIPGSTNTSPYALYNYNQRDLYRWSFGGGYYFASNILGKAEYSLEDSHLISSARTPQNNALRGTHNFFVGELAVRF